MEAEMKMEKASAGDRVDECIGRLYGYECHDLTVKFCNSNEVESLGNGKKQWMRSCGI